MRYLIIRAIGSFLAVLMVGIAIRFLERALTRSKNSCPLATISYLIIE